MKKYVNGLSCIKIAGTFCDVPAEYQKIIFVINPAATAEIYRMPIIRKFSR